MENKFISLVRPIERQFIYAKEAGAKLVIINIGETPCDELADIVINSKAGETMAGIVKTSKAV